MKSGSPIIGRPWMLPKIARNESMSILQEGGETIPPTQTLSKNMNVLLNTACSLTTSRRSR